MPSLKDIKRRLASVEKTQQITRAMRMVAGAKLRRAQETIESARPYAKRMRATLGEVAQAQLDAAHPLLERHESVRAAELVVVSSNRGLCGAFNAGVIRQTEHVLEDLKQRGVEFTLTFAGKKAQDYFKRRYPERLGGDYPQESWVTYGQAAEIAARISERYVAGEVDEVTVVCNEFVSVMTQRPRVVPLLPYSAADEESDASDESEESPLPYEIEPDAESLLKVLVPKAVETVIYRALLENQAGEHAARMTAMESATRNTEELIESLTLQYNRARQAAITKELVEIVSGAGAL